MSGIIKVDKIQKSNGTGAIDIDNSGNVGLGASGNFLGIGTTSPSHPLHIVTSTDGTGLSGDDKWAAVIQNAEATDARSYGLKIMAGSTTDQAFAITDHDGVSDIMAVRGDGKISIGTRSGNTDVEICTGTGTALRVSGGHVSNCKAEIGYDASVGPYIKAGSSLSLIHI